MTRVRLGRTGLEASILGLGCGGPSRIGQTAGRTEEESVALVRKALDSGINFFDTAETYGTEAILGRAFQGVPRESFIVCTKKSVQAKDQRVRPEDLAQAIDGSLARLRLGHIDIFYLHGVLLEDYDFTSQEILPAALRLREQGKFRFLGLTENFRTDTRHRMLERALQDDVWDVVMVGFNLLNPGARERVFPVTRRKNIGVVNMYAVRRVLGNPARVRETVAEIQRLGLLGASVDEADPLGFLVHAGGASSVVDAAYRLCRHEPGVHVVLSGTGDPTHLEANVKSILSAPLPEGDAARLRALFSRVDSISGN
ncbi:MAG: aldo/keto reductase [Planctomycetes bacterium]|nr:aldo/keto reductase [Planctomycetota bacterium]